MTEHVPDGFSTALALFATAWGKELPEAAIRAYWHGLRDLPMTQVKAAFERAMREQKFFPAIATIRHYVEGAPEDAMVLAWATARKAAGEVGAYVTVTFEDGAIATAIETVFSSWSQFCQMEEGPELHTRRTEFLAAYRTARSVEPQAHTPRTLRGLCETAGTLGQASLVARVGDGGSVTFLPPTALEKLK